MEKVPGRTTTNVKFCITEIAQKDKELEHRRRYLEERLKEIDAENVKKDKKTKEAKKKKETRIYESRKRKHEKIQM